MARTNKSLVSDFIKDALFNGGELTEVTDAPLEKKMQKVLSASPNWKSATVSKDNQKSIADNICLPVNIGDVVAFNDTAINVRKHTNTNGCTLVANVKRGKLISVTHAKDNKQVLFCL